MTPEDMVEALNALRAEVAALKARVSTPTGTSMTLTQTAARLGCSRARVFQLLRAKSLARGRKAGRDTMVTLASIEAYERGPASVSVARPVNAPIPPPPFDLEAERAKLRRALVSVPVGARARGTRVLGTP